MTGIDGEGNAHLEIGTHCRNSLVILEHERREGAAGRSCGWFLLWRHRGSGSDKVAAAALIREHGAEATASGQLDIGAQERMIILLRMNGAVWVGNQGWGGNKPDWGIGRQLLVSRFKKSDCFRTYWVVKYICVAA